MPSRRATILNAAVRVVVRRRSWGGERALTRRARLVFGAPPLYRSLVAWGVRHNPVRYDGISGEWLVPKTLSSGVILYVHGGGFVSCSAATHRPIAAALARWTGCRVFSPDYRLAPEHRFPAAIDDLLATYHWLLATGAPGQPIAIAGDSAGGNLAFGMALRLRDTKLQAPACIVAFSPWTDLAATGKSARSNDGRDHMFCYENLADFASVYLGEMQAETPDASPAFADLGGLPPVLLHVASTEILLDDSVRIDHRIRLAGGVSRLRVFDDVAHCWQMLVPFVPEASSSIRDAASFISARFSHELTAEPGAA